MSAQTPVMNLIFGADWDQGPQRGSGLSRDEQKLAVAEINWLYDEISERKRAARRAEESRLKVTRRADELLISLRLPRVFRCLKK